MATKKDKVVKRVSPLRIEMELQALKRLYENTALSHAAYERRLKEIMARLES
jgi:hypothetical protein